MKIDPVPEMGMVRNDKPELAADIPSPRHELMGDGSFRKETGGDFKVQHELGIEERPQPELAGDARLHHELWGDEEAPRGLEMMGDDQFRKELP